MLKPCLAFLSLSVDGGIFHQKTQVHHHRFEVKEARCFFPSQSVGALSFSFSLEWRHCPSSPFCLVVLFISFWCVGGGFLFVSTFIFLLSGGVVSFSLCAWCGLGGVASSLLPFRWCCVLSSCWLVELSHSAVGWRSLPFSSTTGGTTSKKDSDH